MNISRIILGAFGYVYEYRKQFAKALLIPISLLVSLGALPTQESGMALTVLLTILFMYISAILAITTHRIIILGPKSVSEWGVSVPGKREFYFVLYSIGFGLFMIPFAFLALIPTIGWIIAVVAMLYTLARFSLVFPAIATDRDWSFSDAWNATRNHQILMIIVAAIFPVLISIPEHLLSHVPYMRLLVNLLSAITLIFIFAALSVAFKVITENGDRS